MERLSTRLRTLFPSARWPRRWRPPRGDDLATAGNAQGPVGYLVNRREGLAGVQGIGYDYVLGAGGLYVQSESAHLTARVLAAPCDVRGSLRDREGGACPRPHPGGLFEIGAALVQGRPGHRAVLRRAVGRALLPAGGPATAGDGNVPRLRAARRGGRRVPLPRTLPRLLLEDRRLGTSRGSASTASRDASTPTAPS